MRWMPLDAVGLYVPGRQGGLSVLGADERDSSACRGCGAHRHVRADAGWRAEPAGAGSGTPAGCRGNLSRRRRAGDCGAGLWHRDHRRRWTASSGQATPMSPRRSVRCSAALASMRSPARRRLSSSPTRPTIQRRVAIDLLAQAEHDEAAQAILITDDAAFAASVADAVRHALAELPRALIAGASWQAHGAIIVVRDWDEATGLVNRLAPEHLQLMLPDPEPRYSRVSAMPAPCSWARFARKRWATTWRGRTTCCRRVAPPGLPPASRYSTSSSAPPG